MKSRKRFINAIAGDEHIPSQVKPEADETSEEFTKRIHEQNRHSEAINGALDSLLDGRTTPKEYIAMVNSESTKLSTR